MTISDTAASVVDCFAWTEGNLSSMMAFKADAILASAAASWAESCSMNVAAEMMCFPSGVAYNAWNNTSKRLALKPTNAARTCFGVTGGGSKAALTTVRKQARSSKNSGTASFTTSDWRQTCWTLVMSSAKATNISFVGLSSGVDTSSASHHMCTKIERNHTSAEKRP